jgi:hypothetical protein
VMAGDQADNATGQPQSGFWFGSIDDLWRFGKPAGWGGVWRRTDVREGEASDPFLMTGFDQKTVHLVNDGATEMTVGVEVDPLGDGVFRRHGVVVLKPGEYRAEVLPAGFSAHWVRFKAHTPGRLTVELIYN